MQNLLYNQILKRIRPATWESINDILIGYAKDKGIEQGRKVRIDCTVVETNIHKPTDSELLWDGIRVLTRLLNQAVGELGLRFFLLITPGGARSVGWKYRMPKMHLNGSNRTKTCC